MDTISMNNLQHACPCLHLVVLLQPLVNIWLKTFLCLLLYLLYVDSLYFPFSAHERKAVVVSVRRQIELGN